MPPNRILISAILITLVLLLGACTPAAAPPTRTPAQASPTAIPPTPQPSTATPTAAPPTPELSPTSSPTPAATPTPTLEVYRKFETKELNQDGYGPTFSGIVAGGMYENTDAEWQELRESGWTVAEDASNHAPVLITPEVATQIKEEYGNNFGASPWAEIIEETRGSTLDNKIKIRTDMPAIATIDSSGNPIVVVSLAEFNTLGSNFAAVILTKKITNGQTSFERIDIAKPAYTYFRGNFIRWDEEWQQLVLADEFETTTHVLKEQDGKYQWEELKEYKLYGTRAERLAQSLKFISTETRMVDGKPHTNILGLDQNKITQLIQLIDDGESIATVNQRAAEIEAGIEILTDPSGEPTFVVIVGGEYGLDPVRLANTRQAAARLEEIDPGISQFLVEQFGAKVITGSTSFLQILPGELRMASNDKHFIIISNMTTAPHPLTSIMFKELGESGELFANGHLYYVPSSQKWVLGGNVAEYLNPGTFTSKWVLAWAEEHKAQLTADEYQNIKGGALFNLNNYSK